MSKTTREQPGANGLHDGKETVDSVWISPNNALALHEKDDFGLMLVTKKQLSDFAAYTTAAEFLEMARSNQDFPTFNPSLAPVID